MTVKLLHNQYYKLKGTHEVVQLHEAPNGKFWYWKDFDSANRKAVEVTENDIEGHSYLSRGGVEELETGDIVVYLSGGFNTAPSIKIGQVVGFKNARVTVNLSGQFGTSNIAPNNLMIVTESKLRKKYNWIR